MVLGSRRRVGLEGVTSQGEVGSPAGAGVPRTGWIKDDDVCDDDDDGVPRAGWIKDDDVGDDDEDGVPRAGCIKDDDVGDDDDHACWADDFDDDGIDGDPDDDDVRTSCLQMIPWLSHLSSISSN